ncbi:acyltransferase family protein [Arcticibacter svalbardensis MN12-7]|uniref:Acyltransferase family protein n=1 Tax=Arcticibacter svalbardensis MN12-7 TaxID=1150600 RepID=R9GQH0_9SPHI|nr:acyltransferase [Arcticibacter svalbardensis]EOR94077.1 acyltransferase family protein [Arcticibacter svalbardensis MN12-7]
MINYSNRIFGFDFLRCLAILFVLIDHGAFFFTDKIDVENFTVFGFLGVEIFFVLSGFLIGGIFIKTFDREDGFNFDSLKNFWIRRWFRTVPNYYLIVLVTLFVNIFIFKEVFSWSQISLYFLFLQNSYQRQSAFFGESWSLAIEEWFYLTLPVLMILSDYLFKKVIKEIKFRVLFGVIMFFISVISLRTAVVLFRDPSWDSGIRKMMPLRLDSILFGVLGSWVSFYYKQLFLKFKIPLVFLGLVSLLLIFIYYLLFIVGVYSHNYHLFSKVFYFTLTDICFLCFMPFMSTWYVKKQVLVVRMITIISVLSYSIYLIHRSIIISLLDFYFCSNEIIIQLIKTLLFLVLTFVFSYFIYKYYEHPITELREKFNKKRI